MSKLESVVVFNNKRILEDNGILCPIEFDNEIPFKPKRLFYVYGVPDLNPRGQHAHYKTKQILSVIVGSVEVRLHDGKKEKIYGLSEGDAIYVPNLIWDEQVYKSKETVLLSICSTHYNIDDYINDFDKFLNLKNNGK